MEEEPGAFKHVGVEVGLGVQGAGSHPVRVCQAVLPFQLGQGIRSPGFQFGPGPAGFHHLGILLLVALSPVFHLVGQVPCVLVQAGDSGLGLFEDPLLPVGLSCGIFRQQLCLEVQDIGGVGLTARIIRIMSCRPSVILG